MTLLKKLLFVAIVAAIPTLLSGCGADDGKDGANGTNGTNGSNGANGHKSLVSQSVLAAGNTQCFKGGLKIETGVDANDDSTLQATEVSQTTYQCDVAAVNSQLHFNRVATLPSCLQINATCNTNDTTVAEIAAASTDGMTLIYTDSPKNQIGFVNLADPANPVPTGILAMGGEPTSVTVKGGYALVAVNTSADYVNTSGKLVVVDIATKAVVHSIEMGGQPDSVAISPDGKYIA